LPQIAQGPGNTVWMIPSELTSAMKALSSAFDRGGPAADDASLAPSAAAAGRPGGPARAHAVGTGEGNSAADAVLAEVVHNAAELAGNAATLTALPQAALAAAVAAVPQAPPPPDVPLPEALLDTAALADVRLPEVSVSDPAVREALNDLDSVEVGDAQDPSANGAAGPV
jgi:hypothetical protein